MKPFWVSEAIERNGLKTVYINPLPEKYCTFDCVFCPLEQRTAMKTELSFHFEETAELLIELEDRLRNNSVDAVFIMPDGEGLANGDLALIYELVKRYGCKAKIISNGYILNNPLYKKILLQFDEVIGELMTTNEEDFHSLQRPMEGYSLKSYVENMAAFSRDYSGEFNLSITLLKNYSDNEAALRFFKEAARMINPSNIYIETPEEGKLQEAFGVDAATIERFNTELNSY